MPPDRTWQRAIVRRIWEPATDVRAFELVPADGIARYPLGSHVEVQVTIEGRSAVRCYSLVGQHALNGAYRIAVKRVVESRGGSRYLWSIEPGATLEISEPRSHFELRLGCPEYLLIAGGIGITPLLGMAEVLMRSGARFWLLYAGRSRAQMAFLSELRDKLGERLRIFVDDEGTRLDLDREISGLHGQAELYVCGPLGMMQAARRAWSGAGRPTSLLRLETFGSSGQQSTEPFRVSVVDHRVVLDVARDESLLEALARTGIDVPGHCRRGECGLCMVKVIALEGSLDHRDVFLDDEQRSDGRTMCPCVSRATGSIAIDTGCRENL